MNVTKMISPIIIALLCFQMLLILIPRVYAEDGLVGYWAFDEGSGNTVADSSVYGNNGTLNNEPTWVDGIYGKALDFDGVNDYIQIPQSSSLDVTDQVTVEAWVYPRAYVDNLGATSNVVARSQLSGATIYTLATSSEGKVLYAVNPTPPLHSSVANLPLNTWTHLAMTYNGSYVRLYINGTLDSYYALSGLIQTTTNWLAIGCRPNGPYGGSGTYCYFNGTIDDVRIYNRALNQQEIQIDMIPEFSSVTILPIFMMATLLVIIIYIQKKQGRKKT